MYVCTYISNSLVVILTRLREMKGNFLESSNSAMTAVGELPMYDHAGAIILMEFDDQNLV